MKLIKFIFSILFYLSILVIIYTFHVNFIPVNVVFYSAIFDSIIASIITIVILWNRNYFKLFTKFEKLQIFFVYLLFGYSIAISVPTVFDRSLSLYLIEKIKINGGRVKMSEFENFTKDYMKELRVIDVRLTEQFKSGNIIIENECIKLTKKGMLLASISYNFRRYFLPKKRLLMGKYSADLTDIFKNSGLEKKDSSEFSCK